MLMRASTPFAYETAGAARARHSLRPLVYGGTCFGRNSDAFVSREGGRPSLRGATATKQSMPPLAAPWIASRSLSSGAHSRDPLARNDGGNLQTPSFRGAPLGANLRCAIAHRGIHPTAILAAQWNPGSRGACHRAALCADPVARPGMTTEGARLAPSGAPGNGTGVGAQFSRNFGSLQLVASAQGRRRRR